jgi:lysophospholipase L1-like esterase
LALGDSYTIGEGVEIPARWPNQLVARLKNNEVAISSPVIITQTGWRSDVLQDSIELTMGIESGSFDLVSLLIGVNDQFQGKDISLFPENFSMLLDTAISFGKKGHESVFVVSIPDYSATPYGQGLISPIEPDNLQKISKEIDAYNEICRQICDEKGVLFVSITEISRGH